MISETNSIKLIDFGLSTTLGVCLDPVGSRSYCAPEVWDEAYDPFVADAWSLGICLFSMKLAFFPFERAHRDDSLYQLTERATCVVTFLCNKYKRKKPSAPMCDMCRDLLQRAPDRRRRVQTIRHHPWLRQIAAA